MLSRIALPGTGGIADAGQLGDGIGLKRVGMREGVAKVGRNIGQFALSWCASQTIRGVPEESFHNVAVGYG